MGHRNTSLEAILRRPPPSIALWPAPTPTSVPCRALMVQVRENQKGQKLEPMAASGAEWDPKSTFQSNLNV